MNVMAVGVANRSPACWPGLKILPKALYRVPQCDVEVVWKFMEVVVTDVRRWPGVAACVRKLGPMRNGSDPVKEGVKAVFALSGSGWESNPPGNFSDATMGLKPTVKTQSTRFFKDFFGPSRHHFHNNFHATRRLRPDRLPVRGGSGR